MKREVVSTECVEEVPQNLRGELSRGGMHWLKITRTVTESCFVAIAPGICERCFTAFPDQLDDYAANFVLDNHDGMRVVFLAPLDARPERDRYPVADAVEINGALCCGRCADKFHQFMLAGRAGDKGG